MPTQKNSASWDLQLAFNSAFKRLSDTYLYLGWQQCTDVSKYPAASIRTDGTLIMAAARFLRNVSIFLPDYTASHPLRHQSSVLSLV